MPEEIKCSNCGATLSTTDEKCPYCGTPNPKWRRPVAQIGLSKAEIRDDNTEQIDGTDDRTKITPTSGSVRSKSGCMIAAGIILILTLITTYILKQYHVTGRQIQTMQEMDHAQVMFQSYNQFMHWHYFAHTYDDSTIEYREAEVYSTSSLPTIDSFAAQHNYPEYYKLSAKISEEHAKCERLSIREEFGSHPAFNIKLSLPDYYYSPFLSKQTYYVLLRFDGGQLIAHKLESYSQFLALNFTDPNAMLEKLKHTNKLTVLLAPEIAPNYLQGDTARLIFQTDSLIWPSVKTLKTK